MAEYRITYWKDIPSQVDAFDGAARVRHPLSGRFLELIDAAAMRQGLIGTDAYVEQWRMGPIVVREGTPGDVAEAVAAELEAQFDSVQAAALGRPGRGTDP
jgi:hypothetical protein